MARRCLNTEAQRHRARLTTVPNASRVAGADKVRLGDVLSETITGEWGGESSPSKGVAVLRTTNFTNFGEINYDNLAWREIAKDKVERKHLCVGDIVVEKSGGTKDHPVGRVVFFDRADGLYLCNNFTQILRPDRNLIVPRFLFYTLRAKYEMRVTESMYNKTTGIQNLKMSLYMAMPVVLPPLPTQRRIAAELDRLCALKKNAEDRLAILDQLVKSRFVEMFGDTFANPKKWETRTFREASLRLSDGPFGSNLKSSHYSESGVRVIRLGNIGVGEFLDEDRSYIPIEHYEKLKKYTCRKGELVFGTLGEPNLRACLIPEYIEFAVNKSDCVHYVPRPELLDNQFVCSYVNSAGTLRLASSMVHGQTRTRVSSGQIAVLPIFVPPMKLQREFAAFVASVDKSKAALRETVATLDQLYRAKLQEYFG